MNAMERTKVKNTLPDDTIRLDLKGVKNNRLLFESLVRVFIENGQWALAKACFDEHTEEELALLLAHPDKMIREAVKDKLKDFIDIRTIKEKDN